MSRLWTSGRLLKCILKNHNLSQSLYEVLRTNTKKIRKVTLHVYKNWNYKKKDEHI